MTAAYLNVSSQYQTQTTETVQAMQVQGQNRESAREEKVILASAEHFMESYYQNLRDGNRTRLIQMVEDPDSFYSDAELRKIKAYVENYQDFQYDIERTSEEDEYILFIFYKTKLYDADTAVPGMAQYYIVRNNDQWVICNNTEHLSETARKELKASLRLREVKQLIEKTNTQYQKAIASDEFLREYFEEQE